MKGVKASLPSHSIPAPYVQSVRQAQMSSDPNLSQKLAPFARMGHHQGKNHLPVPSGPYSVGCLDVAQKRGVFLRLFYPHKLHLSMEEKVAYLKDNSSKWCKWLPEPEYANAYLGFKYSRQVPWLLGRVFTWLSGDPECPILKDEKMAEGPFPLIVFSHGNGGCRDTYSILCSDMASKGFTVASIEHSDGSASIARTVDANGDLDWINPRRIVQESYETRHEQVSIRARECRLAYQLVDQLHRGDNLQHLVTPFCAQEKLKLADFAGKFDLKSGAVLSGHSFGGASAVKALADFGEFSGAFVFDSWLYPIKDEAEHLAEKLAGKSLVYLNYQRFQSANNLQAMKKFNKKIHPHSNSRLLDSNAITLKNAIHYTASDLPTIFNGSYLKYPLGLLDYFSKGSSISDEPKLGPEQGLTLSSNLFTSWLNLQGLNAKTFQADSRLELDQYLQRYEPYLMWGTDF